MTCIYINTNLLHDDIVRLLKERATTFALLIRQIWPESCNEHAALCKAEEDASASGRRKPEKFSVSLESPQVSQGWRAAGRSITTAGYRRIV